MLMLLIAVLQMTGLWRVIISGLQELRGEKPVEPPAASLGDGECYRVLGLSSSATWEEIEQAYRRKAKILHPDHGGDEYAMSKLNAAYLQLRRLKGRK